jgi:hypothetical protein
LFIVLKSGFEPEISGLGILYKHLNLEFNQGFRKAILWRKAVPQDTWVVKVYPIPATDVLNIKGALNDSQISIFDITGKLIKNMKLAKTNLKIEISKFPKGLYFLKIYKDTAYKVIRFTKN